MLKCDKLQKTFATAGETYASSIKVEAKSIFIGCGKSEGKVRKINDVYSRDVHYNDTYSLQPHVSSP